MWEKPLPNLDMDNKPVFERYKEHEFPLYRCQECGEWYYPKSLCRHHDNEPWFGNIELEPASGRGTIFAFCVVHQHGDPSFEPDIPFVTAVIELDEGPVFGSWVIDVDPAEVEVGQTVEVTFKDIPPEEIPPEKQEDFILEGGFSIPYFVLTEENT